MKKVGGYISAESSDKYIVEEFKGQVLDKPIKWPKELGAEHPFEFNDAERLYKKYGLVSATVNKFADSIVSDFQIKLKNPNAQKLIDDFIHDTNFHTVIREWTREGVLKGNGFIELDLENTRIRVLNSNHVFVRRTRRGRVLEYTQWLGKDLNRVNKDSNLFITFKPNEIAHLSFNKIPNDPYGVGYIWPNERVIENLVSGEQDHAKLIKRKAGSPYHIKVGQPGNVVSPSVVDDVKKNLQYLTNRTEWVTDADVDIQVIEFKDVGKNLTDSLMYYFRMFVAGVETPEVKFGSGQLNEGIAKVQESDYLTKIKSLQTQVESIIEEKIIRPFLKKQGLDEQPQFIWNLPTEEQINNKVTQITALVNSMQVSMPLRAALEIELANLLDIEGLEKVLITPQDAKKKEEEMEQRQKEAEDAERKQEETKVPQPEVPGAKPNAAQNLDTTFKEGVHTYEKNPLDMTLKEWVSLQEIAGFNYTDYLVSILGVLKNDKFADLKAVTEVDIAEGLLPDNEIEKLRIILKDGFTKNQTIRQIEKEIKNNVNLKDRTKEGKVTLKAKYRPNMIARTETVRLSNDGLINMFKENNIEKVRWIAALSDRTCPICEKLNGQVFEINTTQRPPAHVGCRCSLTSVIE